MKKFKTSAGTRRRRALILLLQAQQEKFVFMSDEGYQSENVRSCVSVAMIVPDISLFIP